MTGPPVPKYLVIAQGLRWQIANGEYEAGDVLVVEELDQEWEATSPTVVRALGVLEQDNLIRRGEDGWTVHERTATTLDGIRPGKITDIPGTPEIPAMASVEAVGYVVVLCSVCGLVWSNPETTVHQNAYEIDVIVGEHGDLHESGAIVVGEEVDE